MAYLSKELLLKTYKTLSGLTEDHRQGQTQIVSAMRHLLAFDMYFKKNNTNCSLGVSSNRDDFVENVKKVVNISGDYYTTNFYTTIKPLSDCGVGSNFFSAGVVNNSKQNTAYLYDYPTRGQYPLFRVKNNELIREIAYYKNVRYYLKSAEIKCAFVLWVLRKSFLTELNAASIKEVLQEYLTTELIEELMPKEEVFNQYVKDEQIVAYPSELDVDDLLSLFHERNEEHEDSIKLSHKYSTYLTALRTKPFLLLAGISGTGKSRIVKEMAFASCPDVAELRNDPVSPGNYLLVEVKPNWHDSTELLGYESTIKKGYVLTPFVKFLYKAMKHPDVPFFVCLDEMNLAPVEQYFAEYLSILESRKQQADGTILTEPLIGAEVFRKYPELCAEMNGTAVRRENVKNTYMTTDPAVEYVATEREYENLCEEGLRIPQNVVVIGTVNMDETTHQFSRKVIDRAMTIEMNEVKFDGFFESSSELTYPDRVLPKEYFLPCHTTAGKALESVPDDAEYIKANVPAMLEQLNEALADTPFKIAYRVQNELVLYFAALRQEEAHKATGTAELLATAMDQILMMKVLPRIEGDDELLEKPLERLAVYAEGYPKASAKIKEMQERLGRSHFTSFWP